ncbi:MAG TPA: CsbD family protein [Egibacteraceae bacterium]|nr:CsbD family protein [Egibacteraceae bacterium]
MGGNTKKAKGRVKQAVGAITGDKKLQREGKRDERVGSLENKADDATDAVHDKVDEVIERVSHEE